MNLYSLLMSNTAMHRNRIALRELGGLSLSYAEIEQESARIASVLKTLKLQPGQRVLVQMEKSVKLFCIYYGCLRSGLAFVPINPHSPLNEALLYVDDIQPSLIICDSSCSLSGADAVQSSLLNGSKRSNSADFFELVSVASPSFQTIETKDDALAAIIYTSGSTGRPKGVMLPHALIASNALAMKEAWAVSEGDTIINTLPLFNTHGLSLATNSVILSGGQVILTSRFDPAQAISAFEYCTMFTGVPTMYTRLLSQDALDREACGNMRLFVSSSAGLHTEIAEQFQARTGHAITQCYGLTETGTLTSYRYQETRGSGNIGRSLPGVEIRIMDQDGRQVAASDIGDLQVRKQHFFLGYWPRQNAADYFTPDGFYKTGDKAHMFEDGTVGIVGRTSDVINTGGFKVYPKEVESALLKLACVRDCAVVGIPHADLGEIVAAVVVAPGQSSDSIKSALQNELSRTKMPRLLLVIDEVPRNHGGKIDVKKLRQLLA